MEEEYDDDIYFLTDDPEFERIYEKAEAELDELSDKQHEQLLEQLDNVLDQYAEENGYKRIPTARGIHTQFIWSPPNRRPTDDVFIYDISMMLDFLIPGKYPPLWKLMKDISTNPDFSQRTIIAMLILRDLISDNLDGAIKAEKALDDIYRRIRPLTTEGHASYERRKQGGISSGKIRTEKSIQTEETIETQYNKLRAEGKKEREMANIIAKRTGYGLSTVRKYLNKIRDKH